MKALVLKAYSVFTYEDVDDPEIGPDDALVEVKACGICGSDVHGMDGSTGRRQPPIIMGHEAAGVIVRTGAAGGDWKSGDRVTFDSTVYCGSCWFCRRGQINLCDNRRVLGVSCSDYRRQGAMARYVAVPQRILYRLPDRLSFEESAMVEALSIAVHAAGRVPVTPEDTAVVVGVGMIGLLIVQVLRAGGCRNIVAVDLDEDKLGMAGKMGAAQTFKADACDVAAEVRKLTAGRGADVAFEVVGLPAAFKTAVASVRKGGSLVLVGNVSPSVDLPLQAVVTREVTLYGSCASAGEYPACLEMIAQGKVDVRPLISAVAPLQDGADWFERLYRKEAGLMKVILAP